MTARPPHATRNDPSYYYAFARLRRRAEPKVHQRRASLTIPPDVRAGLCSLPAVDRSNAVLKVELKPGERVVIGRSVVTNGSTRTQLLIDGADPVLRERDIMQQEQADTPAKSVFYILQMMYLSGSAEKLLPAYTKIVREITKAAPSFIPILDQINNYVLTGALYKGFREAKKLVVREQEIFEHAKRSAGLRKDGADDGEPA